MDHTNIYVMQCMRPNCRFRFQTEMELAHKTCPKCDGPTKTQAYPRPSASEKSTFSGSLPGIEVLLDNIRSAYNVGSIFRSADAAGVQHIHVAGFSPAPEEAKVKKTALGSELSIPWTQHWNALEAVRAAKEKGYLILSLEIMPGAISIFELEKAEISYPLLLVVGNEVSGVDPAILQITHHAIEIPMFGIKKSINVATAFGIAAYFLRQHALMRPTT